MTSSHTVRRGFTLIELMVVIGIICVLVALLLPAVQACREAARRCQCINNLKQLSTAVQSYALTHNVLPPGVVNPTGPIKNAAFGYHYSWITQVLPYIERGNIDRRFVRSAGVYDPVNQTCREVVVNVLLCPSDPGSMRGAGSVAETNYAACHHDVEAPIDATNTGCFYLNSHVRIEDVEDGTSNTLFIGEKPREAIGLGWASGTKATLRNTSVISQIRGLGYAPVGPAGLNYNPYAPDVSANPDPVGGFGSAHSGGFNAAFGDGSVKFIKNSISSVVFRRLGNRADGEMIDDNSY